MTAVARAGTMDDVEHSEANGCYGSASPTHCPPFQDAAAHCDGHRYSDKGAKLVLQHGTLVECRTAAPREAVNAKAEPALDFMVWHV